MRIKHNDSYIRAADYDDMLLDEDDNMAETLDDMSDQLDDLQEDVEEVQEDDIDIDVENNIEGHYIAECEMCHGVFISAVIENEQHPEKVSGVCPLCGKDSDQYLKWIVHLVD